MSVQPCACTPLPSPPLHATLCNIDYYITSYPFHHIHLTASLKLHPLKRASPKKQYSHCIQIVTPMAILWHTCCFSKLENLNPDLFSNISGKVIQGCGCFRLSGTFYIGQRFQEAFPCAWAPGKPRAAVRSRCCLDAGHGP